MTLLILAMTVAMLLTIWFKTNAVVEYLKLFRVARYIPGVDVFSNILDDSIGDPGLFVDFLTQHYDGFILRLVTCPICLSTWLGTILAVISGSVVLALPVAFLGLILYLILGKLLGDAKY